MTIYNRTERAEDLIQQLSVTFTKFSTIFPSHLESLIIAQLQTHSKSGLDALYGGFGEAISKHVNLFFPNKIDQELKYMCKFHSEILHQTKHTINITYNKRLVFFILEKEQVMSASRSHIFTETILISFQATGLPHQSDPCFKDHKLHILEPSKPDTKH